MKEIGPSMDVERRYSTWVEWLKVIEAEITQLALYRHVFRETAKIVENNARIHKPSVYFSWMRDAYITYATVGLRKQLDCDPNAISMWKLLDELARFPQLMTRERYKVLYKGSAVEMFADRDFDRFAGAGMPHLDPSPVQTDLRNLEGFWKVIKQYTNRKVAHIDRRGISTIPTFGDLDSCQDCLEELLKKYVLLFRASNLMSVVPVIQDDWQAIFRESWITPSSVQEPLSRTN